MKILKILLPFFPNNDYLQKHWWHRLVLVTATIISILSILAFIFFATAAILDYQEALYRGYFDYELLVFMIIAPTLGLLVPNVVYRIMLYIVTGSKWKTG